MKHFFLLILALLGWAAPAQALDPAVRLGAFHQDTWTSARGAPREIEAMAQTADGWLWLGTTSGLYRFDGVKFDVYRPRNDERLLGASITALAPRPNGELWIGYTFGGMSVLKDGVLKHVSPRPGDPIGATFAIAFDEDSVWVAATTGLMRYRDGSWTKIGKDWAYPAGRAEYVYRDHYGRLWVSEGKALYLLDREQRRFAPVMEVERNPMLLTSPDGRVWVAAGGRLRTLPAPPGGWRPLPASRLRSSSFQSLFDRDGNFWKGNCPVGLCRMYPASWQAQGSEFAYGSGDERIDQRLRMSSLNVHSMMEDREGNIWAGTVAGLERFRHNRLLPVELPPEAENVSLAQDASGVLWSASAGLNDHGKLWRIQGDQAQEVVSDQKVYMLVGARDGSILMGGNQRVERRLGDKLLASYPLPPLQPGETASRNFVILLADDIDGFWVGIAGRGLWRWQDGAWLPPAAHPQLRALMFATLDPRGRMWFGFRNNRLLMREGGQWKEYGEADGIAVGSVRFIDASGEVLISGDHGTAVLREGRFRPLVADQPDLLAGVSGIAMTPDGDRWFNTVKGLLRARAQDWARAMAEPSQSLRVVLWNALDGYPGSAETIARNPTAFTSREGKVWLATTDGIARFDADHVWRNTEAPKVEVLALQAGGRRYRPGELKAFAPGTEQFQIDYTALSYTMPERIRFRYRLVGLDHDWQEVGTRRVAYYTNVGPGRYRFEVSAVNEDGVASQIVATPEFEIEPRFVQTRWFYALCVLLGALGVYLLYQLRLVQVKRQIHTRLEARLNERERIARTLHDTFLQSLQGLILRLQGVAVRLPEGSETRAQLDSALDLADKVVAEGRDQVMDLRIAHGAPTLADALAEAAENLREGSPVAIAVRTVGECVELPAALHYEVYNIAREAIANAVRHARASHIEIVVACGWRTMSVTVRDDGVGIDAHTLEHGRPGHWGLTGMRERAAKVGAGFEIRQRAAGGTEVVLQLPRRLVAPAPGESQAGERSVSEV